MQIVIDVPEDAHGRIVRPDRIFTDADINAVVWAVYNGIELPKGHGRLIDADALKDEWKEGFHKKIVDALMDEAPTVLEADNETKAK